MFSLLSDATDGCNEAYLLRLIENKQPETLRLEYKREITLGTLRNNKEAAKDVSSFANSIGGRLIVGVAEEPDADGNRLPAALIEEVVVE